MKKTIPWILAMLIVLSVSAVAFAAPDTQTTNAKIEFIDGPLKFVPDPDDLADGWSNMDIDFKTQYLPTGLTIYTADEYITGTDTVTPNPITGHVLRITDGRSIAGDWHVNVEVNRNFAPGTAHGTDPTFDGILTLANGTFETAGGQSVDNPPDIVLDTSDFNEPTTVVTVGSDFLNDQYDVKWRSADISLEIDANNAVMVKVGDYTAELLWTLVEDIPEP